MPMKLNSILGLLLASSLHAQPPLHADLQALALQMRSNNLYQHLLWDFMPINPYSFNQSNGNITYTNDAGKTIVANVEIMGSFFLGDNTFLWADKNKSVDARWCTRVAGFRQLLPEPCRVPKFNTTVDYLIMLSAAFGGHLNANAVDYVRQGETILFFALKQVEIIGVDDANKSIVLPVPCHKVVVASEQIGLLKDYLQKYIQINQDYIKSKDNKAAFDALDQLKAAYFEDFDDFLPLQDPINPIAASGRAFTPVIFDALPGRLFIIYSSGEAAWPDKHRAYEVRLPGGTGKPFLRSYEIYGL